MTRTSSPSVSTEESLSAFAASDVRSAPDQTRPSRSTTSTSVLSARALVTSASLGRSEGKKDEARVWRGKKEASEPLTDWVRMDWAAGGVDSGVSGSDDARCWSTPESSESDDTGSEGEVSDRGGESKGMGTEEMVEAAECWGLMAASVVGELAMAEEGETHAVDSVTIFCDHWRNDTSEDGQLAEL